MIIPPSPDQHPLPDMLPEWSLKGIRALLALPGADHPPELSFALTGQQPSPDRTRSASAAVRVTLSGALRRAVTRGLGGRFEAPQFVCLAFRRNGGPPAGELIAS